VNRSIAALRLLRGALAARAMAAQAIGRSEAAQAFWSVHSDVTALITQLEKRRRQ